MYKIGLRVDAPHRAAAKIKWDSDYKVLSPVPARGEGSESITYYNVYN